MLAPYDETWPRTFAALRDVYARVLGDLAIAIEHVGSTAVPGLLAKPIIDIDIVITSELVFADVAAALSRLGYRHAGCQGIPGREVFKRDDEAVPRDGSGRTWPMHHLYVCASDSAELRRHLSFRDWLRGHPETASAYATLKQQLAERHDHDRDRYTEAKTEFIAATLLEAWCAMS